MTSTELPKEKMELEPSEAEETLTDGTAELYARSFGFIRDQEWLARPIAVKHVGTFEDLLASAESHGSDTDRHHAQEIITAFHDARVTLDLSSGKQITRRPHLLITGGFIRDTLLKKQPKDIDFATNLTFEESSELLNQIFAQGIADERITIKRTGESFPVLRIAFKDSKQEYEIATFRKEWGYEDGRHPEHIEPVRYAGEDADRRDFTANALFYNPLSGNIIDYVGGLKDIEQGKLRFVGDPYERIAEDHLRMPRYVRFLEKTGLNEDPQAKAAIRECANDILRLKSERITEELTALFHLGNIGASLERLREYGLLKKLLPDVLALASCKQGPPYHMEGDGFAHTILVANGLPKNASTELAWAAILHDIGKPDTRSEERDTHDNVKIHFLGHEKISAEKAAKILDDETRFQLPNKSKEKILNLIREHIAILSFPAMRPAKAQEFAARPYFPELIALTEADTRASHGDDPAIDHEHLENLEKIRARYQKIQEMLTKNGPELEAIKKLINGNLIQERYMQIHDVPISQKQLIGKIKTITMERITDAELIDQHAAESVLDAVIREFPPE